MIYGPYYGPIWSANVARWGTIGTTESSDGITKTRRDATVFSLVLRCGTVGAVRESKRLGACASFGHIDFHRKSLIVQVIVVSEAGAAKTISTSWAVEGIEAGKNWNHTNTSESVV